MKDKLKRFMSIFVLGLFSFSLFSVKAMKPVENTCSQETISPASELVPLFKTIKISTDIMPSFIQNPDWPLYSTRDCALIPAPHYNALPITSESYPSFINFVGYIKNYIVYNNSVKGQYCPLTFSAIAELARLRLPARAIGCFLDGTEEFEDIENVVYTPGSINESYILTMLLGNVDCNIYLESNGEIYRLILFDSGNVYSKTKKRSIIVFFKDSILTPETLEMINELCSYGVVDSNIMKKFF